MMHSLQQHVTNPETCIQCSACEMACPMKAIESILGRFCVDFDKCGGCGKCIEECPTSACDCFIQVASPFSTSEQSQWTQLPETTFIRQDDPVQGPGQC